MKRFTLRKARLIVALFFLIGALFLFLDFTGIIPTKIYTTLIAFQFVPSLLKFLASLSIATAGFILILLVTSLFGRVYCASICPLGLLQDVIVRIQKRFRKKKVRYKYKKGYNIDEY